MSDKIKSTHPSYGVMSFSRIQGGGNPFYGSELTPDNYIQMTIHTSEQESSLTGDNYYEGKRLVQVRMTANQYAEMITSMNSTGIPVTIEILPEGRVETLTTQPNKLKFIQSEFKQRMTEYGERVNEYGKRITTITSKKVLSKADAKEIDSSMRMMTQEINSNIPFFLECFQEMMDKVVVEAKTTIEAAISQKIQAVGLQELHRQNKLLTSLGDNTPDGNTI